MKKRQDARAAQAHRRRQGGVPGQRDARPQCRPRQAARAVLAPRRTAGPISARARSSSCAIRTAAGSTPRSIACRCTARTARRSSSIICGRHGAIIAKKYWDKGEPCPVAVVNGQDPALFIAGFEYLPDGQSEYDFAGSIKGAPIETMRGPSDRRCRCRRTPRSSSKASCLPMREHAAGRSVRRVHRLLRRRRAPGPGDGGERASIIATIPILLGSPPMKPPRFHFGLPFRAASIWSNLDDGRRHRRGRAAGSTSRSS